MNTESITTHSIKDLFDWKVLDSQDESPLGSVKDFLIDINMLEIAALVTKDKILQGKIEALTMDQSGSKSDETIRLCEVENFLLNEDIPGENNWLPAFQQVIGQNVVSTTGEILGNVSDILIDERGHIVAYRVKRDEPERPHISFPTSVIHSVGSESLIISDRKIHELGV